MERWENSGSRENRRLRWAVAAEFAVATVTGVCFHYVAGGPRAITESIDLRSSFAWTGRFFVDIVLLAASMVVIGLPIGLTGWLISGRERSRRNLFAAFGAVLWAFIFPPALALLVEIGISFRESSVLQQVEAWMGLPVAAAMVWRVHRPQSLWG